MASTYTEIVNYLFFRFFRNLCNILHECDGSATPEKPGINEGLTIILFCTIKIMVLENIFASSLHLKALFVMGLNSHFFACFFLSQRLNIF